MGKLIKIDTEENSESAPLTITEISKLNEGVKVEHARFGYGKVLSIEGIANDKKALIDFIGVGKKYLLLRFAKLKIKS